MTWKWAAQRVVASHEMQTCMMYLRHRRDAEAKREGRGDEEWKKGDEAEV